MWKGVCCWTLLLFFVLSDCVHKQGMRSVPILVKPRINVNGTYELYWRSGGEGFFSLLLQLKTLNFIVNSTQIRRTIHMDTFYSRHYENGKLRVSLCDYIQMTKNILCGEFNVTSSKSHLPKAMSTDLRHLNRPGDVAFQGDPGWWDFSIHKAPVIKSVVAPFPPFLKFQPYLQTIALYVRNEILKLTTNQNHGKPYIAVHWRRGDQLTTRCIREKGMIDRSINCGSVESFITHLQTLQRQYLNNKIASTQISGTIPIVILTNEDNATVLNLLRDKGFLLPPKNIVQYLSASFLHPATLVRPSHGKSTVLDNRPMIAAIERAAHACSEVVDLMVDSILMMQALDFYAYGGSFVHDVIESERMLQGKSHCLHPEGHSAGSFCHAYQSTSPVNRTLFRKSLQEFWRHPLVSLDSSVLGLTTVFPATAKARSLQLNFSFS